MRDFFRLGLPIAAVVLLIGCKAETVLDPPSDVVGTVTLRFQAEGKEFPVVMVEQVADGATLDSVLRKVDDVSIEMTGSGSTTFVHSIEGLSTGSTEGWTFKVDGEFANQGVGQTVLHPPTTVDWTYGGFEP